MNILFLLIAIVAAAGVLFALFKPGCGFLGFCKGRRWMPVILWIIVLIIALILWRSWMPDENVADVRLTEQGTVIEQNNATYIMEETRVTPAPEPNMPNAENAGAARNSASANSAGNNANDNEGTAISDKNSTVPDSSGTTNILNSNDPQTPRERFDDAVDNAAGAAAGAYNATREKVNEFGKAAAETWDDVRHSTGETLERAGDSINETGRNMQNEN